MQFILLIMMVLAAIFAPLKFNVQIIAALFFIGAFFAATHDISIDGYYMEALDKDGQAKFVGYRTMAFRVAWLTGPLVIVTVGTNFSWFLAFLAASIIFGFFFVYHFIFLKEVETVKRPVKILIKRFFKKKTILFFTFLARSYNFFINCIF